MVLIRTSTETWSAEYTVQGNRDAQIVVLNRVQVLQLLLQKSWKTYP